MEKLWQECDSHNAGDMGNVELSDLSRNVQNQIGELILREQIERFDRPETYLTQWQEFCKRKVL